MIDPDKTLIEALLATQLRGLTPEALHRILAEWKADPSKDFLARLLEAKLIESEDRSLIESFVDEALRAQDGDIGMLLKNFGGRDQLERSVFASEPSLANVGAESVTVQGLPPDAYVGGTPLRPPGVDETPGRYTGESEYARGGMGRVLLVHDEHLGRDVAMKELLPLTAPGHANKTPVALSIDMVSRFLREARVTGQLEHPSIVPVYELGRRRDGTIYYTMKLVRGKTLSDAIKDAGTLAGRLAYLTHFTDLCQAIAYAHSRGVIHRDIKPSNVMVGEFGETVVLDWGLAKSGRDRDTELDKMEETIRQLRLGTMASQRHTTYGHVLGTPTYMPPEQASGQLDRIDTRSDVYSLGAVLYELLSGTRPFVGVEVQDILRKVIDEKPPDIESIEPDAPPELIAICKKAMSYNQNARYASARELAAEVRNYLSGAFVGAYRYSLREYLTRWTARHKALVSASGFALAAILIVSAAYVVSLHFKNVQLAEARDREHEQRLAADTARSAAEHHAYVAQTRLVSEMIDRRDFASARATLAKTQPPLRGWEWGHQLNLCNQDLFTIPGCPYAIYSPDGTTIATLSFDNRVKRWNAKNGAAISAYAPISARPLSLAYSPDGTLLVAGALDGGVYVWRADETGSVRRFAGHHSWVTDARFQPDSKHIISISSDGMCRRWNVETGQTEATITVDAGDGMALDCSPDGTRVALSTARGVVELRNGETLEPVASLAGRGAVFSADGTVLARIEGARALLAASATGQDIGVPVDHGARITSLIFGAKDTLLATVGDDGNTKTWSVPDGLPRKTFNHGERLGDARFAPDGKTLLTMAYTGLTKTWDVQTGKLLGEYHGHSKDLSGIAFNPTAPEFLSTARDQDAKVWSLASPLGMRLLFASDAAPAHLDFASQTGTAAVSFRDGMVQVIDLPAAKVTHAFVLSGRDSRQHVAISKDGGTLAVAFDLFTPVAIDLKTDHIQSMFYGHTGPVMDISLSPDASRVVSCSADQTARIWESGTGRELAILRGHSATVQCARFSPDGRKIVTTSDDKTVRLWNAEDGALLKTLEGHTGRVSFASFNEDGSQVFSASEDGTARIWNVSTGECVAVLTGDREIVRVLTSNGGSRAFTLNAEGALKVWDPAMGEELFDCGITRATFADAAVVGPNASILALANNGNAYVMESAPFYSQDHWKDDAATLSAGFQAYKTSTLADPARQLRDLTPVTIRVFTTPRMLNIGLDQLKKRTLEQVHEAPLHPALKHLGLRDTDTLVGVNDNRATDPAALARLLDAAAQTPASDTVLNITRSGQSELRFELTVVEPYKSTVNLSLTRARVTQIVSEAREAISANADVQDRARVQNALDIGEITSLSEPVAGIWLAQPEGVQSLPYYTELGLATQDRLLAIDGVPVTSASGLIEQLGVISKRLVQGEIQHIQMEVERGALQRVDIIIAIS